MKHRRTAIVATLAVAGALFLGALSPVAAAETAKVRVLHASPDAPAVDVYLNDTKVDALTNVPFGIISGYLDIPAGTQNVKVYATGTMDKPVIDANLTLEAGKMYTVAAASEVAKIEAQVLVDSPNPTTDKAQVRVIHFSADAPAVDIAPKGGDPIISALAYPKATDYLALDGGTYDLEVRLAGTTTVALDLPGVAVENGKAYSVFAIGSAASPAVGGNALKVVATVDATAAAGGTEQPPTNAAGFDTSGTAPSPVMFMLLAVAALAALVIGSRYALARSRSDR
jgi:hypothetical protein